MANTDAEPEITVGHFLTKSNECLDKLGFAQTFCPGKDLHFSFP